jgi:dihydroorotate dehydrogenase (NAD+) catalytic subunit
MKVDLVINPPMMNASGSLGFAPEQHGPVDLRRLGAFVTNPVSLERRSPAQGVRCLAYPGGFLLHTGHPNPGLKAVIHRYAPRWRRSPVPILVHLLAQEANEIDRMVRRLEGLAGVAGFELGLPPQADGQTAASMIAAAAGELPVVLRLPLERAGELAEAIAATAKGTGLAAISLGPPQGALLGPDHELVHGRLYGPAVFPLALAALLAVRRAGLPVIAGGGIYRPEQVEALLAAGASAVQVDAVLWRAGWWRED